MITCYPRSTTGRRAVRQSGRSSCLITIFRNSNCRDSKEITYTSISTLATANLSIAFPLIFLLFGSYYMPFNPVVCELGLKIPLPKLKIEHLTFLFKIIWSCCIYATRKESSMAKPTLNSLSKKRKMLREELCKLGPFLGGSIVGYKRICGTSRCRCQRGYLHSSTYFSSRIEKKTQILCLLRGNRRQKKLFLGALSIKELNYSIHRYLLPPFYLGRVHSIFTGQFSRYLLFFYCFQGYLCLKTWGILFVYFSHVWTLPF